MSLITAIIAIAATLALAAMIPGPSFILVARTSLAVSRRDGMVAALGMGAGGAFFSALALVGLLALLAAVPWLHLALKVVGGGYLIYLGIGIWRGAKTPVKLDGVTTQLRSTQVARSFMIGFLTQISNPKTAVVYASVFASLLPAEVPLAVAVALPFIVFVVEASWYAIVALVLSAPIPRQRYFKAKLVIDRTAGAVTGMLGARLIADAGR